MNTPVVDFVRRYAQQRTTRMHMPGHKGRGPLGCEERDITEIAGADELYEAEGIIAQSEANATQLFSTARTYYSTEGSSQCIRAMLHLALQMRPAKAGRPVLLAARNAHKALLYAAALLDFDIQWLWPAPDAAGALCTCPVEPEALCLCAGRAIRRGPYALRRLPHQPGLSGLRAGYRGAVGGLPRPRPAPSGGQRSRRLSPLFEGG